LPCPKGLFLMEPAWVKDTDGIWWDKGLLFFFKKHIIPVIQ